jgi:uncharacterized protein involved in exopolysaccharide biosynthesis
MLLYTGLASGYSITSGSDERVDYFAVNNAFDNILTLLNARETLEELSLRLLATHLSLEEADTTLLSQPSYQQLHEWLHPDEMAVVKVSGDAEASFERIVQKKHDADALPIRKLLNTPGVPYNVEHIRKNLSIQRKSSSDILELTYTAHDPAICQYTLQLLAEIFMRRYKEVKSSETRQVVSYFEQKLSDTQRRLREAEDRLRDFGVEHRIINYNEQTKFISEAKEELGRSRRDEEMQLAQSEASLQRLEESLQQRTGIIASSDKVLQLRKKLGTLNYRIAEAELQDSYGNELPELRQQSDQLKEEIQHEVSRLYRLNFTEEGIFQPKLLTDWLNYSLEADASRARIRVIDQRMSEFEKVYEEFAPLGSTLNRLEREVSVVEKEYLSLLHGLNQAKLRQQNLEISQNLKIIDGPYYPEKPQGSKRAIMVAGASFVTFVLLLAGFIALRLFDFSLRTPKIAVERTGLPLAGALPVRTRNSKVYDLAGIQNVMLRHLANRIRLQLEKKLAGNYPKCFALLGAGAEVKTTEVARLITAYLHRQGEKAALLSPQQGENEPFAQRIWSAENPQPLHEQLDELKSSLMQEDPSLRLVFIVLPDLSHFDLPVNWLQKLDMSLLVVKAGTIWNDAEAFMLHNYETSVNHQPCLLLDEVSFENLEGIMGEVPRRRSLPRRVLKKLLMFQPKN